MKRKLNKPDQTQGTGEFASDLRDMSLTLNDEIKRYADEIGKMLASCIVGLATLDRAECSDHEIGVTVSTTYVYPYLLQVNVRRIDRTPFFSHIMTKVFPDGARYGTIDE